MKHFGSQKQIASLRALLDELLARHFQGLSVGHIVPASFVRRCYEAEIVSLAQGRTAWLQITEDELLHAVEGDSTSLHESLTRFLDRMGFIK